MSDLVGSQIVVFLTNRLNFNISGFDPIEEPFIIAVVERDILQKTTNYFFLSDNDHNMAHVLLVKDMKI